MAGDVEASRVTRTIKVKAPHLYLAPRILIYKRRGEETFFGNAVPLGILYQMKIVLSLGNLDQSAGLEGIFGESEYVEFSIEKSRHHRAVPSTISLSFDDLVLWKLKYS